MYFKKQYSDAIKYLAIILTIFPTSMNVYADAGTLRSYSLYNNSSIQLNVPDSWRDKTEQQLSHLPPTITFTPLYGTSFHILVSPMWAYRKDITLPNIDDIKELIELAAENAKAQAVENSISINQLENKNNKGYYYSATDKAPKPGEYKYMTQGMLRIGELVTTFTILVNDDSVSVTTEALKMLSDAVHSQKETQ